MTYVGAAGDVHDVTPRAGVWIEIRHSQWTGREPLVTPRAGVWIEIGISASNTTPSPVTPRAGVWIEITDQLEAQLRELSHSPCGSMD